MRSSTTRFDGRAGSYATYRPGYPDESVDSFVALCGLSSGGRVADIGAGTGIFSEPLVRRGLEVFAVEPNADMRDAVVPSLVSSPLFHSVNGTAEATTLSNGSVDAIVAAQAFHWFDPEPAKAEMRRILRQAGRVGLIWNRRDTGSEFQREYETVLRKHAPDYDNVVHTRIDDGSVGLFLNGATMDVRSFANVQRLDLDGLLGRASSSSYTPEAGTQEFDALSADLAALFERFEKDGAVPFQYETRLFVGELADASACDER